MAGTARTRRGFGAVRRLPSKRIQASYLGPDLARYAAPDTFEAVIDAEAWLTDERRLITAGTWVAPPLREAIAKRNAPRLFGDYAPAWLIRRDLKPSTRALYGVYLDRFLLPTFGDVPLTAITPADVADWHHGLSKKTPTARAHAYALLRTVMRSAVDDDLIPTNPCRIHGAGSARRVKQIRPASLEELAGLVEAMPPQYRAMVLLSSWCGLRFGEVTELRRKDVDLKAGVIRVRRGVTRVKGERIVGTPKSDAGSRDVAIPPHLIAQLRVHLAEHSGWGKEGLLFPSPTGSHLAQSTLNGWWYPARDRVGRPDLRWHDLRHTGAVLAAATGATLAELMARLGHSTPGAALRYQHAAAGRDQAIAAKLSELARG